jgi:hypothetical protein
MFHPDELKRGEAEFVLSRDSGGWVISVDFPNATGSYYTGRWESGALEDWVSRHARELKASGLRGVSVSPASDEPDGRQLGAQFYPLESAKR